MTRILAFLLAGALVTSCAKAPGPEKGETAPPGPGSLGKRPDAGGARPPRPGPKAWFDRFMVDLPNGAKLLVDPFGEKLRKWGKVKPGPFRKAIHDRIVAEFDRGGTPGLAGIEALVVSLPGAEGEEPVEFRIGDYASVEEIECSETK